MRIKASVENSKDNHQVRLETDGKAHSISIPPKESGFGSSANGGELLCLALATCYCNDLYREAGKLGIQVRGVEVEVEAEFGKEGEPARHFTYRAQVDAPESAEVIHDLMKVTDRMAEIQNTLRKGAKVDFKELEPERRRE